MELFIHQRPQIGRKPCLHLLLVGRSLFNISLSFLERVLPQRGVQLLASSVSIQPIPHPAALSLYKLSLQSSLYDFP